jgi:signal peptidase I
MTNEMTSRRVPWVAIALSFLAAGVGHVYCGRIAKGLPLYFAWLIVPIFALIAAMMKPTALGLTMLIIPVIVVFAVYLYAATDAWGIALRSGAEYSLKEFNRPMVYWLMILVQLVFSVGLIVGIRSFVYEAFIIPTSSMSPTIVKGDRVLARKLISDDHFPSRGSLVVYRNPSNEGGSRFLGRIVAVSGDKVEIKQGKVIINGNKLERDLVPDEGLSALGLKLDGQVAYEEENSGARYLISVDVESSEDAATEKFEATVPDRHVFILGDNRDRSRDSRHLGAIHAGDIVGYVDYLYWPSHSWKRLGSLSGN